MEAVVIDGVNVSQVNNTTATGVIIDTLGSIGIGASVDIINAGIGYTPSSGFGTYSANLETLSGSGSGAVASVTVNAGGISSCFITNGGTGYAVGDELGITHWVALLSVEMQDSVLVLFLQSMLLFLMVFRVNLSLELLEQ